MIKVLSNHFILLFINSKRNDESDYKNINLEFSFENVIELKKITFVSHSDILKAIG